MLTIKFLMYLYIKTKKKINLPVCNQVRYLEHLNHSVIYDDVGNTKKFEKAGLIRKAKFGRDYIRVASCKEIFNKLGSKDYQLSFENDEKNYRIKL